jgi:hypothetical protein
MTTRCYPRLYADDRGIWVEDMSGHASGTEWDEVADVAGYKEEGIPRGEDACVRILLGLESGHEIPLRGGAPGFAEVVEAISKQLAGMPIGWFAQIERLQPKDAVTVWCRSEATPPQGYPRVLADDRGVWKENEPGRRFVTAWDQIDGVVGEGGTASNGEVCTCIKLELTDKDLPVDLHPDWPGFAQVIEAMTDRLPAWRRGGSPRPSGW